MTKQFYHKFLDERTEHGDLHALHIVEDKDADLVEIRDQQMKVVQNMVDFCDLKKTKKKYPSSLI